MQNEIDSLAKVARISIPRLLNNISTSDFKNNSTKLTCMASRLSWVDSRCLHAINYYYAWYAGQLRVWRINWGFRLTLIEKPNIAKRAIELSGSLGCCVALRPLWGLTRTRYWRACFKFSRSIPRSRVEPSQVKSTQTKPSRAKCRLCLAVIGLGPRGGRVCSPECRVSLLAANVVEPVS